MYSGNFHNENNYIYYNSIITILLLLLLLMQKLVYNWLLLSLFLSLILVTLPLGYLNYSFSMGSS